MESLGFKEPLFARLALQTRGTARMARIPRKRSSAGTEPGRVGLLFRPSLVHVCRGAARDNDYSGAHMALKPDYPGLLSGVPGHLSTELFAGASVLRVAAGNVLFRAGDTDDDCYRVEDGLLKVTMVSRTGAERILAFLGRGAIVGELSIIDGLPRSASVVAVRHTILRCLSRVAFEDFAERHPELYKSLIKLLAKRLRGTDAVVAASTFLSLKGRVARTMLEL